MKKAIGIHGIGRKQLYPLYDQLCRITNNRDVIKVAEELYRKLHSNNDRQIEHGNYEH